MVNYWKSKLLPKIKKVFENPKKAAAVDACRLFDESKEQYSKEFEDKKNELQPKVVEIYEASSLEIKSLIKERKESGLKKHSAAVEKFLDELTKIEFPGSKSVCESCSKVGPGNLPGPIFFVFEKVSTFVVVKEEAPPVETAAPPPPPEKTDQEEPSCGSGAAAEVKEKEIVAEEIKNPAPEPEAEKTLHHEACSAAEPPPKQEEAPPAKP